MANLKAKTRDGEMLRSRWNYTIRSLNDLYVLVGLTSRALLEMQKRVLESEEEDIEFEAPSASGEITTVSRDKTQLSHLLVSASTRGIYEQSLVNAVALTEDYLQGVLKFVLKRFPRKLTLNIAGQQADRNISLDIVLDSATREEILDTLVQNRLVTVFYGPPERYFEYIQSVLSMTIEKEVKDLFAEIKAARDIVVHNSGIANETYLFKAKKKARAQIGERLNIGHGYFKMAIRTMKRLTTSVYTKTVRGVGRGK